MARALTGKTGGRTGASARGRKTNFIFIPVAKYKRGTAENPFIITVLGSGIRNNKYSSRGAARRGDAGAAVFFLRPAPARRTARDARTGIAEYESPKSDELTKEIGFYESSRFA